MWEVSPAYILPYIESRRTSTSISLRRRCRKKIGWKIQLTQAGIHRTNWICMRSMPTEWWPLKTNRMAGRWMLAAGCFVSHSHIHYYQASRDKQIRKHVLCLSSSSVHLFCDTYFWSLWTKMPSFSLSRSALNASTSPTQLGMIAKFFFLHAIVASSHTDDALWILSKFPKSEKQIFQITTNAAFVFRFSQSSLNVSIIWNEARESGIGFSTDEGTLAET